MISLSFTPHPKEPTCYAWSSLCVGDWATWAGAAAGGVVALIAAWGILKDTWRYARERRARARLVAAHLATPFGRIYALLEQARAPLANFVSVMPGSASLNVEDDAVKLRGIYTFVAPLLEKFNITDAAALPDGIGEKLADAVGEIQLVLDWLRQAVELYLGGRTQIGPNAQARRFEAAHGAAELVNMLEKALSDLRVFVEYCNKQFE